MTGVAVTILDSTSDEADLSLEEALLASVNLEADVSQISAELCRCSQGLWDFGSSLPYNYFFPYVWLYCWSREVATAALISYLAKSNREDTLSIKSSSVNAAIHPYGSSSDHTDFTGSVEHERAESMNYSTEEKHQDCGKQEQTNLGVPKCASIEHQTLYDKQ